MRFSGVITACRYWRHLRGACKARRRAGYDVTEGAYERMQRQARVYATTKGRQS